MGAFVMTSISLLALVFMDAIGDAFRFKGWQIVHHVIETLQVVGWFAIWALFGFDWHFIVIYIMGRIMLFDIVWNLITGHRWLYVGKSDLYGKMIRGIANIFKVSYEHPSFIIKFIGLLVWVGWIIKYSAG